MTSSYVLTLRCTDRPGIVHAVTTGVLHVGGNLIKNDQFTDPDSQVFCMRTVVETTEADADTLRDAVVSQLGDPEATLLVRPSDTRPRVLIMASKFDHCLADLLYRWWNGFLHIDVPLIVSNHPDCAALAERYDVPFLHLPITNDGNPETSKEAQETRLRELVEEHNIDLVVLARYMQILSDDLCSFLDGRAINIHHSFLPGFKGAKPYHQAHERGVKLVGATAHFVTADLDEGPIIEQDVQRVTHAQTAEELVTLGQDTERVVLSRAVRAWAEDRVFLVDGRTVVFS